VQTEQFYSKRGLKDRLTRIASRRPRTGRGYATVNAEYHSGRLVRMAGRKPHAGVAHRRESRHTSMDGNPFPTAIPLGAATVGSHQLISFRFAVSQDSATTLHYNNFKSHGSLVGIEVLAGRRFPLSQIHQPRRFNEGRIEGIVSNCISRKTAFPSKALLAGINLAAVMGSFIVGLLHAQSASTTRPSFEVASIKINTTPDPEIQHWGSQEVYLTRARLLTTIADAYQIPYTRVVAPRDSKSQDVLRANYDVTAKAERVVPRSELLLMLQTLFEDRFKLAVHHESKRADVYKLIIAKGGPKLEESTAGGPPSGNLIPGGYAVKNSEVWRFCAFLSGRMGRPVLDQTGLTGLYNFALRLDTLEGLSNSDPDFKTKISDWSSSSIFSDIQKQLGLQLVSGKAPVDYLVIDHVEKPSEN
jgi:uncharacterized protein (TIGR03435 family)